MQAKVLVAWLPIVLGCWGASPPVPARAAKPAAQSTPPACSGAAIDFDQAARRCTTDEEPASDPSPEILELSMQDVEVVSGQPVELLVQHRNASSAPLSLVFTSACWFTVTVFDDHDRVANWEGEDILAGVCGTISTIAITLAPGGVLTKRIGWAARKDRLVCSNDDCHVAPGSSIAPGVYRLEIGTPFGEPEGGHAVVRSVSAKLTVRAL